MPQIHKARRKFAYCILESLRFYFRSFTQHFMECGASNFRVLLLYCRRNRHHHWRCRCCYLVFMTLCCCRWHATAAKNRRERNAHARTFSHISESFSHEAMCVQIQQMPKKSNLMEMKQQRCVCMFFIFRAWLQTFSIFKSKGIAFDSVANVWFGWMKPLIFELFHWFVVKNKIVSTTVSFH